MSSRLRNIARIRSGARELGDRMSPEGKAKLIAKFLAMYGKPVAVAPTWEQLAQQTVDEAAKKAEVVTP